MPNSDGSVRQHFEESKDDGISWATWFDGTYRRTTNEPRLQVEPRNQRRGQLPHAGWPDNSLLSSPVMHPWSTGWRCVGAVTAVATIVAGLISMDHHAESRHEICEEHGELVHVETGSRGDAPDELLSDEQAILSNANGLEHGEHCALEWSAPQSPQRDRLIGQSVADQYAVDPHNDARPTVRSFRRYRLAPKTSPPA